MPRHPSDPGLDHLRSDPNDPAAWFHTAARQGRVIPPLSVELDQAVDRLEVDKDEAPGE